MNTVVASRFGRVLVLIGVLALLAPAIGWSSDFVSVKDPPYNARGDGNTDDSTAIQSAINDVIAGPCSPPPFSCGGGTVFFPPGVYIVGTSLTVPPGSTGPTLLGVGAATAGLGRASEIRYMGTASAPLLFGRKTIGLHLRNLAITYSSETFNGILIDLDSPGPEDTFLAVIENCLLSGIQPAHGAAALVGFNHASLIGFYNSTFSGANVGLRGRTSPDDYANIVRVENCSFTQVATPLKNAGQDWKVSGNNFVPPNGTGPAAAYDHDSAICGNAVGFFGNWFGDSTNGTGGTWIKWCGNALTLDSNYIGGDISQTTTACQLDGGSNWGVCIHGNDFEWGGVGVNLGTNNTGISIEANSFVNVNTATISGSGNSEIVIAGNRGVTASAINIGGTITASNLALTSGPTWSSGRQRRVTPAPQALSIPKRVGAPARHSMSARMPSGRPSDPRGRANLATVSSAVSTEGTCEGRGTIVEVYARARHAKGILIPSDDRDSPFPDCRAGGDSPGGLTARPGGISFTELNADPFSLPPVG